MAAFQRRTLLGIRSGKASALAALVGAFALATSLCNAGQYYKWVDDKGVTHFSEKPVTGMDAKKMGTSSKTAEAGADSETPAATDAAPADPSATPAPANNDENCKIAQDRLKALQSGQRIRLVGSDGKFSYLDENQIKEEIQKTQDVLKGSCAKAK